MDNVKNIDLSHDGHMVISTGISPRDTGISCCWECVPTFKKAWNEYSRG